MKLWKTMKTPRPIWVQWYVFTYDLQTFTNKQVIRGNSIVSMEVCNFSQSQYLLTSGS